MTHSFRSLKNPYRAEIHYSICLQFGNVASFTAETIEDLKSFIGIEVRRLRMSGCRDLNASVAIYKNEAVYPAFDWKLVEEYTI